jgi:hypothetical protein
MAGAITPHVFYLCVRKGVTPALSDIRDGKEGEGKAPIIAKIHLFAAL